MSRLLLIYISITVLNIITFSLLLLYLPSVRPSLLSEDMFLENLSAALFCLGFLLGLTLIWKSKERLFRKTYYPVPLLCLVGFLDELSFGNRIFRFNPPRIAGNEFDGIHDIVYLAYLGLRKISPFLLHPLTIAACGLALLLVVIIYRRRIFTLYRLLKTHPPYIFVTIALGLVAFSVTADLPILEGIVFLKFIEELFEMNSALALLFAAFSLRGLTKNKGGPPESNGRRQ